MAGREICYRKTNFLLTVISVASACAVLVGNLALNHKARNRIEEVLSERRAAFEQKMSAYDDDLRQAMERLGFNIVILPQDQNLADFYLDDYASRTMPEASAHLLRQSRLLSINHAIPVLRRKIDWSERSWTVLLIGTSKPVGSSPLPRVIEMPFVPSGFVSLGWEIHQVLGIRPGEKISILGQSFAVRECLAEKGTKDDITIWGNLRDVQKLLDLESRISEIMAVGCRWQGDDYRRIRDEITAILPGTQVIERYSETLARAVARGAMEKEGYRAIAEERNHLEAELIRQQRLQSISLFVALAVALPWIFLLTFSNARERRLEIGILQALGLRPLLVWLTLHLRALAVALSGSALVIPVGIVLSGQQVSALLILQWFGLTFALALGLMGTATLLSASLLLRQDPATVLQS